MGELFPAAVRTAAVGAATILNFLSNYVVVLFVPVLTSSLGQQGTYALFAAMGGVALLSINATVPETKNKTLEEIERSWGGSSE